MTKLPKFLPTIQCQVAPARESNYIHITLVCATDSCRSNAGHSYLLLNVLGDILLYAEFLKGSLGNFDGLLLHFFTLEIVSFNSLYAGQEVRYHIRRFNLNWRTISKVESTTIAGLCSYRPASPWSASRSPLQSSKSQP